MLPSDLHHLPVLYQDIKWKRSVGSHISAVLLTHRATVQQKFWVEQVTMSTGLSTFSI